MLRCVQTLLCRKNASLHGPEYGGFAAGKNFQHTRVMHYLYLLIAILCEVAGTSALEASRQFTRLGPSLLVVGGYAAAFYFLSLTLRVVPVGVAYAIWSGMGVVLIALVARIVYGQRLDVPAILGMSLIVAGVAVIRLFSKTGA